MWRFKTVTKFKKSFFPGLIYWNHNRIHLNIWESWFGPPPTYICSNLPWVTLRHDVTDSLWVNLITFEWKSRLHDIDTAHLVCSTCFSHFQTCPDVSDNKSWLQSSIQTIIISWKVCRQNSFSFSLWFSIFLILNLLSL